MSAPATALRKLLIERFPDAVSLPERVISPIRTGLSAFDQILPQGGLPRGRVVVWQKQVGGATAILRSACQKLWTRGERVAWVDGARSLGPSWEDGPLVVRPLNHEIALRAAEILLKSGGISLVVLTGVDPDQTAMLRLSRMVHEGGGAFVALTEKTLTSSLRLVSRYLPDQFRWSLGPFGDVSAVEAVAVEVIAHAPGWSSRATLVLTLESHDLRLSLEPDLADRRGLVD
jgi:recA bacterial DNA recombination protein